MLTPRLPVRIALLLLGGLLTLGCSQSGVEPSEGGSTRPLTTASRTPSPSSQDSPTDCPRSDLRPFRRVLAAIDYAPATLRALVRRNAVLLARVSGPTEPLRVRRYGRGIGVQIEVLDGRLAGEAATGAPDRVWLMGDPAHLNGASLPLGARLVVIGEPVVSVDGGATAIAVGPQGLLLEECGVLRPVLDMPRKLPARARTVEGLSDLVDRFTR